jgi:hypothetical protein
MARFVAMNEGGAMSQFSRQRGREKICAGRFLGFGCGR